MKRLWLVRLGKHGEKESHALDTGELVLGFRVGDLKAAKNREAVLKILEKTSPDEKPKTLLNFAASCGASLHLHLQRSNRLTY